MRYYTALPTFESSIFTRFFDAVSGAVASRFSDSDAPGEEPLTFLLCELLGETMTARHVLDYSLADAKADLEKSDLGISLSVQIETHDHKRRVEGSTGADLGIVFEINHPLIGRSRRAVLVQAKKLFPSGRQDPSYSIRSKYNSFKVDQSVQLSSMASSFDADNAVFYFLYNPTSLCFSEDDRKMIKAFEAQRGHAYSFFHRRHLGWHSDLDELVYQMLRNDFFFRNGRNAGDEEAKRAARIGQPAVRVCDVKSISNLSPSDGSLDLNSCYLTTLNHFSFAPHRFPFVPLSEFFVQVLLDPTVGSSNDKWIRVAEGHPEAIPGQKLNVDGAEHGLKGLTHAPTPQHTMRITVASTLPQNNL